MMATQRKRAKAGDVLEVKVGDRFAYLQYIGKHPHYGEAMLVSPMLHDRKSTVTNDLLSGAYATFYPVTAAIAQRLVEVVGHIAPTSLPPRFRRPGAMSGRRITTWIVEGEAGEQVRSKLTEDELQLPIASIWNHEYLVQRLQEGWSPSQEGRDS
jgi:hypothetical protein